MSYRALVLPTSFFAFVAIVACSGSPGAPGQSPTPGGIGPAGGSVVSADGLARLTIPAGALASAVSLTIRPATTVPLDPATVGQSWYEITPADTMFQIPSRLQVTYQQNLRPSGSAESELRLHRLDAGSWSLIPNTQVTDESANTSSADVTVTGVYSVRWPDPVAACQRSEDRQFDFWLGEWTFSQTQPVTSSGVNAITRDGAGCVVLENFNGGRGRSLSFFSRLDNRWHQTYIDTSGNRLTMTGTFDGTRMQMYSSAGARWSWQQLDATTIRYFGESLLAGTWSVTFDSRYVAR